MSGLQRALLGNLPAYVADPIGFVERHTIGCKEPAVLRFGPKYAAFIAQPTAIRQILVDERDLFGKGPEQARLRPLFGEGIITSSGDRWHSAREATKAAFSSAGLQDGLQIAMKCLAQEMSELASRVGEIVPLHSVMARLAIRMVAAALFHVRLDDEAVDALYKAGSTCHERLSETMWRIIDFDNIFPTQKNRDFHAAIKTFERVAADIAKNPNGILSRLDSVVDAHGQRVIRDETITMLVAGFETTGTTACWIAYALACRPDLVDWLRPEADATFSSEWGINPTRLRDMPRTRAFVQEVLRLFPAAWWFARSAKADVEVDGVQIKKGTSILVCPWALHRQPDIWESPNTFDPMRFYEKTPPDKFAYIPFGIGPRTCIGQHLAMAELTAITATLVSAFELEPLMGSFEKLIPSGGVTLGTPPGMNIRLHMRPQLRKVA